VDIGVSLDGCGESRPHRGSNSLSVPLTRYYSGDQIKKNETGRHLTPTRERKGAYRILSEKSDERDQVEEGMDGSIILYRIFKKCKVFQFWIDLT